VDTTYSIETWYEAVDACAQELLELGDELEPPIDALRLAKRLGFIVALDVRQPGRARYARLAGAAVAATPTIFLRPEPRVERRHWAVAHEIGERHARHVLDRLGLADDVIAPGLREQTANTLANRLLLPTASFFADGNGCDWDLEQLKRRYATASYELIARRMLEAEEPAIISIFDHGVLGFRRSNYGRRVRSPSPLEYDAWREAHAGGTCGELRNERCRVRAWPIHELGWKREIVRTEPTMEDWDSRQGTMSLIAR
jgi:predicted transcriptional regulator